MQTERTYFTALTEAELPAMMDMAREPDSFKYLKKLRVMSEDTYLKFLHDKLEQIRSGKGYHWAVWLKREPRFVGAVNLNPVAGTDMMQIGCQLKKVFWGQGFASELTARALSFAIRELKIPRVYGLFEKDNGASRRLLEKLGFMWERDMISLDVEVEIHRYGPPPETESYRS